MAIIKDIKDSLFYSITKKIAGAGTYIGTGALIGVAMSKIPTDKLGPFKKACVGLGIWGTSIWISENAKQALMNDMDNTMDVLVETVDPLIEQYQEIKQKESDNGETEEEKTVESE